MCVQEIERFDLSRFWGEKFLSFIVTKKKPFCCRFSRRKFQKSLHMLYAGFFVPTLNLKQGKRIKKEDINFPHFLIISVTLFILRFCNFLLLEKHLLPFQQVDGKFNKARLRKTFIRFLQTVSLHETFRACKIP